MYTNKGRFYLWGLETDVTHGVQGQQVISTLMYM